MFDENPRGAGARHDDGAHVVLTVLAYDVCSNNAGDLRDVEKADREDERGNRRSEGENERCGEGDTWERHDDVADAHYDF